MRYSSWIFEWLDQFDINGWGNEWLCFEYYIYAAYLIIEKDFHVIKTNIPVWEELWNIYIIIPRISNIKF